MLGRLTLAARDIRAGRLVAPFDLVLPSNASFYFCCLPEMTTEPKIEAFRAFVRSEIDDEKVELDRLRNRG